MNGKALRESGEPASHFEQFNSRYARVYLVLRLVASPLVRGPVGRQFMQHRFSFHFAGSTKRFFQFGAYTGCRGPGIDAELTSVDFEERRVILHLRIKPRLCDGGIVDLAMAMTAESDHVDHDVIGKCGPVIERNLPNTDYGFGVFAIHVKNRNALASGQGCGKP